MEAVHGCKYDSLRGNPCCYMLLQKICRLVYCMWIMIKSPGSWLLGKLTQYSVVFQCLGGLKHLSKQLQALKLKWSQRDVLENRVFIGNIIFESCVLYGYVSITTVYWLKYLVYQRNHVKNCVGFAQPAVIWFTDRLYNLRWIVKNYVCESWYLFPHVQSQACECSVQDAVRKYYRYEEYSVLSM